MARAVARIHTAKLDALADLVEELQGQPLLVAYEFNADLDALQERFPNAPYIGAGQNAKKTQELVDGWNAGRITILFAHPASAGHGLNLQGSGAAHIAWFGPIWDLELYQQFIQRVYRQGTTAKRVVNHVFVASDTIDELVMDALRDKHVTQDRLLMSLSAEILRDADSPAAGDAAAKVKESSMLKLGKQGAAPSTPAPVVQATAAQANGANRPQPKGWGASAAAETQEAQPARPSFGQRSNATQEVIEQRAAVTEKLTQRQAAVEAMAEALADVVQNREPVPASVRAAAQFSGAVRQQLEAPKGEADQMAKEVDNAADGKDSPDAKPRRSRAPKADPPVALDAPWIDPEIEEKRQLRYTRGEALTRALEYGQHIDPAADTVEVAKAFLAFLNGE